MKTFKTIIVPIEYQQVVIQMAEAISPIGGKDMFSTRLCNNSNIITHCVSSGFISSQFSEYLTDANTLYDATANLGVTLVMCENIINSSTVSDKEAYLEFDILGLKICEEQS